jgi:hypothetical protein
MIDEGLKEVLADWFNDNLIKDKDNEYALDLVDDLVTLLDQESYEIVDKHKGNR